MAFRKRSFSYELTLLAAAVIFAIAAAAVILGF